MKVPVLFIFLVATITSFAQTSSPSGFEKGKNIVLVMTVKTSSDKVKMDATITRGFNVTDVANGNAVIDSKMKRLQFNVESVMMNQTFDSDNEGDRKGPIGTTLEKYLNSNYTMTIDQAGKVVKVSSDSIIKDKNFDFNESMILNMVEQVAGKITPPAIGETMELKVLPSKSISQGSTWTDSTTKGKTVYTVSEINGDEITVNYKDVSTTEQKQEVMGQTININTTDTTDGIMVVDRQSGFLKQRAAVTNSEGTMNAMGQSMPVNYRSTKTWTVK